jgi:hypothetical protein
MTNREASLFANYGDPAVTAGGNQPGLFEKGY